MIFPLILKSFINKAQENFNNQMNRNQDNRREGEVKIDFNKKTNSDKRKRSNDDEGEYVDYEEVK